MFDNTSDVFVVKRYNTPRRLNTVRLEIEYLKSCLKKGGLRVRAYYRTDLGWFDLFCSKFFCDVTSFPNFERYRKVEKALILTEFDKVEGNVVYVTRDRVHKELSRLIGRDFERYEDWVSNFRDKDKELYEKALNLMSDRYGRTIARKLIESTLFLYTSGQALESTEERVPYSALFPYLNEMGLVVRETKEIVKPKNFTTYLTLDGVRIAKYELFKRLDEGRLYRIARDFGFERLFVVILGLSERRGMYLKVKDVESPSDFYDLIPKIDLSEIVRNARDKSPLEVFCSALCYTYLYDDAVKLFKSLMDLGLAFKYPIHDVYGRYLGSFYGLSREVASVLSSFSFCEVEKGYIERFMEVVEMAQGKIGSGEEFLKALELGVVELKRGGLKLKENFENFAKVRIAKVLSDFYDVLS